MLWSNPNRGITSFEFKNNLKSLTKYMKLDEYETLVKQHRPNLKPISVHTYAVSLKSIEPAGSENAKWIEDTKYVLKQLEKYKETTRKNTLNALIVVGGATAKYVAERDKYNEMYAEQSR